MFVPVEQRTLFLGDLSVHCNEIDLQQIFEPFGIIEQIRLKHASVNKTLSYGFITFVYRECAENALKQMNGSMFLGRALRMGWATPKNSPHSQNVQKVEYVSDKYCQTAQIHFSFISKQIHLLVSEATLRSLFETFGEVKDVTIKKTQVDQRRRVQTGYGFAHFPLTPDGINAAINATNTIRQVSIDNVTYDSCLTRSLIHYIEQIRAGQVPVLLPPPPPAPTNFSHVTLSAANPYHASMNVPGVPQPAPAHLEHQTHFHPMQNYGNMPPQPRREINRFPPQDLSHLRGNAPQMHQSPMNMNMNMQFNHSLIPRPEEQQFDVKPSSSLGVAVGSSPYDMYFNQLPLSSSLPPANQNMTNQPRKFSSSSIGLPLASNSSTSFSNPATSVSSTSFYQESTVSRSLPVQPSLTLSDSLDQTTVDDLGIDLMDNSFHSMNIKAEYKQN